MYEDQFLLKRRPFAATPDPRCFLASGQIQSALDELVVCVEQGQGVAVVSAPAGTGKTLLCERLRSELESRFQVVLLPHASFLTRRAILQSILADLNHSYRRQDEQELRLELSPAIRALSPKREAMVLILDEAHMLAEDLLEELRILSDLSDHGRPLVRLVLVGQPGIEETLARPSLEALNQRIRAHVCLDSFDRATAVDYIDYRITWAGGRTGEIFTPDALDLIYRASDGVPRCINQLCDHALLLAYVAEQKPVTAATIREALKDLQTSQMSRPFPPSTRLTTGSQLKIQIRRCNPSSLEQTCH
jgi:general secretion pathway protein A